MTSTHHSRGSRFTSVSVKVPYLEHCCYCVSLTNGIRAVTATALIFGIIFMYLGHVDSVMMEYCFIISCLCQVTAVLFFTWFLTLMLMFSLNMRFPFRLIVWVAWFITVWLLAFVVVFTVYELLFNNDSDSKDYFLFFLIIFQSLVGNIFTMYSIWLIKSYMHFVVEPSWATRDNISREVERPRRFSPISSSSSQMSQWRINWKTVEEVTSITSATQERRAILEDKPSKSSIQEKDTSKDFGGQQTNGKNLVCSSSKKNDHPIMIKQLFDESRANDSKEPQHGFEKPVLEVMFMSDRPNFKFQANFSKDHNVLKNKEGFALGSMRASQSVSKLPEDKENKEKVGAIPQSSNMQEGNRVICSNESRTKVSTEVLSRISQILTRSFEPQVKKKDIEINSQFPSVQGALSQGHNHALIPNDLRNKVKIIKNSHKIQKHKEQQTSPTISAYKVPDVASHGSTRLSTEDLETNHVQFQLENGK